jgi:hypothetical protein
VPVACTFKQVFHVPDHLARQVEGGVDIEIAEGQYADAEEVVEEKREVDA